MRDLLDRLQDEALVAVRADGAAWPRGMLAAPPVPDAWMGLIECADGRRYFLPAGEEPRCAGGDTLTLVRNRLITVPIHVDDAMSTDGYPVNALVEVLVTWQAREDDLQSLRRSLLATREQLTSDALARQVTQDGGEAALHRYVQQSAAGDLLRRDQRDPLLAHLRDGLARLSFETGLQLARLGQIEFTSRTFAAEERRQQATRARIAQIEARDAVEQAALAATNRRLDDLHGLLDKLKHAAGSGDNLRWHELLPTLSPAERGRLLENLWRITPDRRVAEAIACVTANECLWLDPRAPERVLRRSAPPEDLGLLRSATYAPSRHWLLIGAATGVWALDATTGAVAARFSIPTNERVRTGVNAATVANEHLYATHSQLGAWRWPLSDPAAAAPVLEPIANNPGAIRAVVAVDDGVLFAGDDTVYAAAAAGDAAPLASAGAIIHSLAAQADLIYIGVEDGQVLRMNRADPHQVTLVRRVGLEPIESLAVRQWHDLTELLAPAGRDGVQAIYGSEQVSVPILAADPAGIRRAWASDDLVVGLSGPRDRLIVMNAHLPERTGRVVSIGRLTGRSIQDAAIILKPAAAADGNV